MSRSLFALGALAMTLASGPALAQGADPYQWLEDVEGAKSLDWVKARNAQSLGVLEKMPGFAQYQARALEILNDRRRIAYPNVDGNRVTNFWQDAGNVRGLWRTTSISDYLTGQPTWQTLIDVDALAKAEGKNWVWKGASCLKPAYTRCMVSLSDGGKDAVIWREFDVTTRSFVAGGFETPEAKTWLTWAGADSIMITSDFGPGTLTTSGYGRQVRLWQRGQALKDAKLVLEVKPDDVWNQPIASISSKGTYRAVQRGTSFWTGELYHLRADDSLVKSPLPDDADVKDIVDGQVIALMRTAWTTGGKTYPAGSLVAYSIDQLLTGGTARIEQVYAPPKGVSVDGVMAAKSVIYISVLDNVAGKIKALSRSAAGKWSAKDLPVAANSAVQLVSAGENDNLLFANIEGLTRPDSLFAMGDGQAARAVASLPARFDAAKFEVSQRFAKSKDGTRVPYFVVRPKGVKGPLPTLMWAYGGFEIPLTPTYIGPDAQFWIEEGNQYVIANIRGGGEFGPAWHQAGLKANRQRVFDDFHAVGEALIKTGLTGPKQLGIHGRSNGGLLMGVAYTQRPDLYSAVLMGVPLADMQRYHLLLAGASWMAEYGNPDVPAEWDYIRRYSPYQNIRKEARYPKVFFYTSTKDDRVHPAHARKMAARMEEFSHPYFYYENIDGGHAGVANLKESAYRTALFMVYLNRELKGIGKETASAR
jgi:prolyl oligopeptidase